MRPSHVAKVRFPGKVMDVFRERMYEVERSLAAEFLIVGALANHLAAHRPSSAVMILP